MTIIQPPRAEKRPFEITTHGHTRQDPYFWMRDREDAALIPYLEAETAYMQAMMAHTEPLQKQLYDEILGRIQETDDSVPVKKDEYYYYSRTEEGKQYSIQCRKHLSLDAAEEILLDLNLYGEQFEYLSLGIFEISPDHKRLAFGLDTTGDETLTVSIKELATGEILSDQLVEVGESAEWLDNNTLLYATQDEAKRADRIWQHRLGTAQSDDLLRYHEPDGRFSVYLGKTRDERYIVLSVDGIETTESYLLDTSDPKNQFRIVQPREEGIRYEVDHREGILYIVTNADGAKNHQLVTTSAETPGREHWQTLIPHRPDVMLYDVDLFANQMVRYERENALLTIHLTNFTSGETHAMTFPEPLYAVAAGGNPEYNTTSLRIIYTSFITPSTVYDYNMDSREWLLKKQEPVLGGYDPTLYKMERLWASAEDGTLIPISLHYRRDAWDGTTPVPLRLYGYGSYGMTIDPNFNSARLSLLDRGIIFATAHIRGSQIMGRQWYEDGKFLNKKNTFTDFIACAKHLIAQRYTTPAQMLAQGGSAGGLLIGAVINMAPELFHAAIAEVPFVDVINTMLDPTIPLTVREYDEWGNPEEPNYYDYMLSYSPYDNVTAQAYPNVLVTAGLNDPRVQYWEPTKWVAKLRDLKTDSNLLLLKMQMGAGHFSSSGRYDHLKDTAFLYAFILDQLLPSQTH